MYEFEEPLIAAVRSASEFDKAIFSPAKVIFLLSSDILTISDIIVRANTNNKKLFVHLEFCDGLSKDKYGLSYLKSVEVDGIITTKSNIVTMAKGMGINTVQRFFIIDSLSVSTALDSIRNSKPDMIELMPGLLPLIIKKFANSVRVPIIAGGLIQNKQQIMDALEAGASAISTANDSLWYL